jgi:flagellar biogenesis protein FliO
MKVGEEFILVATAGKSIRYLTTVKLEESEIDENAVKTEGAFEFKNFLDKYLQGLKSKKYEKKKEEAPTSTINTDKYSGGDIFKSNLNKLKSLTKSKQIDEGRGHDTNDK